MVSLKNILRNWSIKTKLIALIGLFVCLLAIVFGTEFFFWQKLERNNRIQAQINRVVFKCQAARIEEKAYLQYYANTHVDNLLKNTSVALQECSTLVEFALAQKELIIGLEKEIGLYQKTFSEFVAAHKDAQEIRDQVNNLSATTLRFSQELYDSVGVKKTQAFAIGEELPKAFQSLVDIAIDSERFALNLDLFYKNFLLTNNEKFMQQFNAKVSREQYGIASSLSLYADNTKETDYIKAAKEINTSCATLGKLGNVAITKDNKEKALLATLDGISTTVENSANKIVDSIEVESQNTKTHAVLLIVIVTIVGCLLTILFSTTLSLSITQSIRRIVALLKEISQGDGDLTCRLDSSGNDELSELARLFNLFIEKLQGLMRGVRDNTHSLTTSSKESSEASQKLLEEANVTERNATTAASASEELAKKVTELSDTTTKAAQSINNIAESVGELATSSTTIAASIQEMSSSINEVSTNCSQEASMAEDAFQKASSTRENMSRLNDSVHEISTIVDIISKIAAQTNLLALNATIEAASAGEAGKGFAVVANEVKELARQSSQAAERITQQINGIQSNTTLFATEIEAISKTINKMHDTSSVIAKAVQAQTESTKAIVDTMSGISAVTTHLNENIQVASQEMSILASNTQEISQTTTDIAQNVHEIHETSVQTVSGATLMQENAGLLSQLANRLQVVVSQFKV